jgi:hypothetical protein
MDLGGMPLSLSMGTYSTAIAQGSPGGLPTPSADLVGQYARVTDLFGEKNDLVLCSSWTRSGVTKYYWGPVRPDWKTSLPVASITLSALKTPTKIRFTGTLAVTQTVTLDSLNAYPGLTYDIRSDFTGIGSLSFTGLEVITAIGSLLTGGTRRVSYDGTGWSAE